MIRHYINFSRIERWSDPHLFHSLTKSSYYILSLHSSVITCCTDRGCGVKVQLWITFYKTTSQGGGGCSGFQKMGMIKNQNLQKFLGLPTKPQKIPCQISSDCFEYPKKFLLKSSHPKYTYPKKARNWKFQTLKNPSIIPVTWK